MLFDVIPGLLFSALKSSRMVLRFALCLFLMQPAEIFALSIDAFRPSGTIHQGTTAPQPDVVTREKMCRSYMSLPMDFEKNEGQTDPQARFLARGRGYSLFLTPAEAVLALKKVVKSEKGKKEERLRSQLLTPNSSLLTDSSDVIRMRLIGGNRLCKMEGKGRLAGKSNYFIGNDRNKWRAGVERYAGVKLAEVYPGIDMVYYGKPFDGARGGDQDRLEYDFVVNPGADPGVIRIAYGGVKETKIDGQGNLVLKAQCGEVVFRAPKVFQRTPRGEVKVGGRYVSRGGGQIGFELGAYDRAKPLVIDPVLDYSTYLGGGSGDIGYGVAVDSGGNAYITGRTASADFPATGGAFQTTHAGGTHDAFMAKLNPAGTALVYSTYLGGSNYDYGYGIAVDSGGNAYVTGSTSSANFPTTAGAYKASLTGSYNAFVTKLNPTGTSLVYSTYLGGSSGDNGNAIALDGTGNAYVTGYASSNDFPTTGGAFQTSLGGGSDGFVARLNATGTALDFSTYLGGSGNDSGNAIALDATGNTYVTGYTGSTNFPTTGGAFQTTSAGGTHDAFMAKLNPAGTALVYSTYLGGSGADYGRGIAVDPSGNAYVTGSTHSADFPFTGGAFQTAYGGGTYDAFAAKLNPAGTALAYSTYLGGSDLDQGIGIAVDSGGNAYLTGITLSTGFPTTAGAYQSIYAGGYDGFVTKLNPTGTVLVFSSYLGGSGDDLFNGVAVDSSGDIYVTGDTSSTDFPTTAGAYQAIHGGVQDVMVAKFALPTPTPPPTATTVSPCQSSLYVSRNRYSPKIDQPPLFIRPHLCTTGLYSVKIYNTSGEHIRTLRDAANQPAGVDEVDWDGKNEMGEDVAGGVYIIVLTEAYGIHVAKVVLIH